MFTGIELSGSERGTGMGAGGGGGVGRVGWGVGETTICLDFEKRMGSHMGVSNEFHKSIAGHCSD